MDNVSPSNESRGYGKRPEEKPNAVEKHVENGKANDQSLSVISYSMQSSSIVELKEISQNDGLNLESMVASPAKKPLSFYMSVICLCIIVLLVAWEAASLAAAIPIIASELHATTLESFWANVCFMLGIAVAQPICATVSDVLGRKLPLYLSMFLYAIGSIVFALANNMTVLIIGRVLQGLGGGGLDVLQAIILADITTLKERPLFFGIIGMPIAIGHIMGPIAGALFAEYVSWRWIGWVNLPFLGIAFGLAFFYLNLRPIELHMSARLRRLDLIGMSLFVVATTCVSLPLSWAGSLYPWESWRTILPLTIGFAFVGLFAYYEKIPEEAVFPYRLFSNITAVMALLCAFLHGSILYIVLLYFPLFFQAVYLQKPLQSTVSLIPFAAPLVGFSVISPIIVKKTRRYRWQLVIGWAITTLFLGLFCLLKRTSSLTIVIVFQAFIGVGVGTTFSATAVPMQASVENVNDQGLAGGLVVIFRLFGGLIGLAIASTIFNISFTSSITSLGPLPEALKTLEDASHALGFIPTLRSLELPDETLGMLIDAYLVPFRTIWIVITCFAGVGILSVLLSKELSIETEDLGRQHFELSL
ncbi:mfs transporter protein [Rutstroemia sp. NJR-2017a WRK4]|nr:mfs transporter protein [Rutstroemia sp. NJR-2017a WRK4]